MKIIQRVPALLVFTLLFVIQAYAYEPPSSIVTARNDSLEINASETYNSNSGITEIINFSVTNYNTTSRSWGIPFYTHLEGVEFFEWKYQPTGRLNRTITGYNNYTTDHNGTLINHSDPIYLIEEEKEWSWKPSKQFVNSPHYKYGKKVNSSTTINIGASSTKYFWARFKTILSNTIKKFDIDFLDPFISAQLYRGGDGAGDFTSDINKTISEPINATATSVTIGKDTTTGSPGILIDDFDRADSDTVGGNWTEDMGNYWINNSELKGLSSGATDDLASIHVGDQRQGVEMSATTRTEASGHSPSIQILAQNSASDKWTGISGTLTEPTDTLKIWDDTPTSLNTTPMVIIPGSNYSMIIRYNTSRTSENEVQFIVWLNTSNKNTNTTLTVKRNAPSGTGHFVRFISGDGPIFFDNLVNITNAGGVASETNVTTAGHARSNQFAHSTTIRRFAYNSSETGGTDGLLFNFTCNGYEGTWSQGGGNNQTRPTENQFVNCPVLGKSFAWETNLSQQQDLMQLNISTIDNTIPSINNTLWNQTVGFGAYTRVNVLNATVIANEPDGENYNVTFNWTRSGTILRFVNVSNSTGNSETFSDNLNDATIVKGDTITITTYVQDGQTLDGHSTEKSNTTIIADFPVELTKNPSFNNTNINADNNILVNLTFREEDPSDSVSVQVTWSRANSHNNRSNTLFSFINTTTNATPQVNLTLLEGNFSGGDNVSYQIVLNSSAGNLGNFTANFSEWFIIPTRVGMPNFTNVDAPLKIDTSPFEFNWTGVVDALSSETNITYRFEYADDGSNDWVLLNTSHPETNFTWSFRGTSGLRFNTTYRFRVRSEFGVNFTDYNITSNITLGENRTDINVSTMSIYGNDQIIGRYGIGSNVTLQLNITPGLLTNISIVNFSLYSPNGSIINTTENASINSEGFLINSSHRFELRSGGIYRWKINATNTAGNETTAEASSSVNGSFEVIDNYFVTPGQSLLKVIDPDERLLFNVSIYHTSPENISFNINANFSNTSAFNVSFQYNDQNVNGSFHNATNPALWILNVNATATGALRDDEYNGNFTVTRNFDNNITVIPIVFGVNPPRGEITMQNVPQQTCNSVLANCYFATTTQMASEITRTWTINNTGAFNLSSCNANFFDAASGNNVTLPGLDAALSITGLDSGRIRPNSTATLRLDISNNKQVGVYTAHIDVQCGATRFGFTDSASANPNELPYININVIGTTGSAVGGSAPSGAPPVEEEKEEEVIPEQIVCGDDICMSPEKFYTCPSDCSFDFDTLVKGTLSGEISISAKIIGIIVVSSVFIVAFRVPEPSVKKKDTTFGFGI